MRLRLLALTVLAPVLVLAGNQVARTFADREEEAREDLGLREPTEGGEADDDEGAGGQIEGEENEAGREAWMAEMHRAPPGVDWKAVERTNGLAQVARRNRLRAAPPPAEGAPRWVERGSDNQAGSTFVARPGTDPEVLYVGSAFGGLWKGTVDGTDWAPIGDNLYGGVNWLEVLPPATSGDPDILLAGTDGGLLHRSTDGGLTWNVPDGWGSAWWTRRLLETSDGTHTLYALTQGDAGTRILRSTDAGATFTPVLDLAGSAGDLWAARDGGSDLYVLSAAGVQRSVDGGDHWTTVGPAPNTFGTAELAASEAGAPTLYAVLDSTGLYRSDDAGRSWTDVSVLTDYWGALNASIDDPAFFVYGGMELHKSEDGGASFATQNYWWEYYGQPDTLLHADMMGLDVLLDEDGNERWYINCHGGTYLSTDRLDSVANLSLHGLRVSQYYDVLTSAANPEHIAAGAQDQGYQYTNGVSQDGDDIFDFVQGTSGDYGHLTSGDGTHTYVYSVYPGSILIQAGEDSPRLYGAAFPSGESYVPWLPPIVADPDTLTDFYFPATHLYRYTRDGRTWQPTQYAEQSFSSDGYEYISAMAFAPTNHDRAWIATSYGRVFYSNDHALTWTQSESLIADENWYYGQAIAPSPTNPDVVTIGGSGYGVPAVYRSEDGGVSFRPWGQGLPDTLVYTLVEAPDGSGRVFAGTQTAAYMRGPDDAAWVDITGPDAPITTYWDAEALASENTIRFATYGRGIFDYQLDPDHTGCYPVTDHDGDGVACDLDCDDGDATVFPGAPDACDGRDQDCDPTTPDESDGDADGAPACDDCDDADPTRHPGASETCGDGVDQDCDGADAACEGDNGSANGGDDGSPDDGDNGADDTPSDKAYAGGCACAMGPTAVPGSAPGGGSPAPPWSALVPLALLSFVARRRS